VTQPTWSPEVPREQPDPNADTKRHVVWLARAVGYLVYAYVIAVEIILAFGFFLLLAGANPSSGFVEWIYRSLDRVMTPFRGIFNSIDLGTPGEGDVQSVFETSVLFAMIVYGLLAILVHALIAWLTHRMERLEREDYEYRRRRAAEEAARQEAAAQAARREAADQAARRQAAEQATTQIQPQPAPQASPPTQPGSPPVP
jgi:hypothetical protein